jgi:2-polyprenyl-3-methyl-5-hydroxy-6-metoxy-1,4-benzoquinol methylase
MNNSPYDDIADWYDRYLQENPIYQDIVLPNVLDMVGEVDGLVISDIACGQGWIARSLARRGAQVTGMDLSERLIMLARRYEEQEPLGITYIQGNAERGETLSEAGFDGAVCILALMNIPDLAAVLSTLHRILKPGGWLVAAISHPCFQTPNSAWLSTDRGTVVRTVEGYVEERFWTSRNPGGVRGRVGSHHRMLSTYLNGLIAAGFLLDEMREPAAVGRRAEEVPGERDIPSLLFVRAHKQG